MIGITRYREQGLKDPLLGQVMCANGMDSVQLYDTESATKTRYKNMIKALAPDRDGPVEPERAEFPHRAALTEDIKAMARDAGADLVGVAPLEPLFIDLGIDLPHDTILCMGVHEKYTHVLEGAEAVEHEASRVYSECARLADLMARHIRGLGYPALAHHNGGCDIQAIPAMYAAGFGELGKHGSLINPHFGASFRPGFVTTTLPLLADKPLEFGVQEVCSTCRICTNNCPGDAMVSEPVLTNGIKRWPVDIAKCYPYSRLRAEYCHICVDVCPYIHRANDNGDYRTTYKSYMRARKEAGYSTPKSVPSAAE